MSRKQQCSPGHVSEIHFYNDPGSKTNRVFACKKGDDGFRCKMSRSRYTKPIGGKLVSRSTQNLGIFDVVSAPDDKCWGMRKLDGVTLFQQKCIDPDFVHSVKCTVSSTLGHRKLDCASEKLQWGTDQKDVICKLR